MLQKTNISSALHYRIATALTLIGVATILFVIHHDAVATTTGAKFVPVSDPTDLTREFNDLQTNADLPKFINALFVATIGAGALLAVIMVTIGGIEYMGTDSYSNKEEAKRRIREAVIGLLILLCSWLILNIINPDLTRLDVFRILANVRSAIGVSETKMKEVEQVRAPQQFSCAGDGCCTNIDARAQALLIEPKPRNPLGEEYGRAIYQCTLP